MDRLETGGISIGDWNLKVENDPGVVAAGENDHDPHTVWSYEDSWASSGEDEDRSTGYTSSSTASSPPPPSRPAITDPTPCTGAGLRRCTLSTREFVLPPSPKNPFGGSTATGTRPFQGPLRHRRDDTRRSQRRRWGRNLGVPQPKPPAMTSQVPDASPPTGRRALGGEGGSIFEQGSWTPPNPNTYTQEYPCGPTTAPPPMGVSVQFQHPANAFACSYYYRSTGTLGGGYGLDQPHRVAAQPEREVPTGTFYSFLLLQTAAPPRTVALLRVECNSLLMDDGELFARLRDAYRARRGGWWWRGSWFWGVVDVRFAGFARKQPCPFDCLGSAPSYELLPPPPESHDLASAHPCLLHRFLHPSSASRRSADWVSFLSAPSSAWPASAEDHHRASAIRHTPRGAFIPAKLLTPSLACVVSGEGLLVIEGWLVGRILAAALVGVLALLSVVGALA